MRGSWDQEPRSSFWRVAVVEDHLLQRKRTEELVDAQDGLRVVHSSETFPEFLRWLGAADVRERPHLVVLDLIVDRGPNVDPERVRRLIESGVRVLVLSALTSPRLVREVIRAGVGGVVSKRDREEDIVVAIWAVLRHEHWVTPELASVIATEADRPRLSDQEERALVLYASGLTLDGVASELGVRPDTAKKYLSRVKAKYAAAGRPVRTKVDLGREATRDGLLDLGDRR
ncbi:MAG TPA: response regulator transcription factor [Marmoricola sp.]